MKIFGRLLILLSTILVIVGLLAYGWIRNSQPIYEGTFAIAGLQQEVNIHYDNYGVPSIQAQNKHDLYMAFGYRHAAERLFQMEMLRRAGSGRLAAVIGQPLVKVDKLFRTLGVPAYAKKSATYFNSLRGQPIHDDVEAYLEGINQFIVDGPIPPEFDIIGITPAPFSVEDMYYALGAMSFSFSQGQKSEFIVDYIHTHFGEQHLKDLALYHSDSESFIPSDQDSTISRPTFGRTLADNQDDIAIHTAMREIAHILPISSLEGSNAWVLGGQKTTNGKVLFCNDTHIGYNLPQTWYEAHLTCPNFEMYGHYLAGIPFALVGRNSQISWGLTMLLNDDVDFYKEDIQNQKYLYQSTWKDLEVHEEIIQVKGESDTVIQVASTIHGPIINDALRLKDAQPISLYWTYTKKDNYNLDALYKLNNATDMSSFESGLSLIHAPGLNINYGDAQGNIAWWTCAHLIKRPAHVNSYLLLDGTTGLDDPIGFYEFQQNPKNINPACGYIYSANDWPQALSIASPDSVIKLWYPGYYKPQYRADRIVELIESQPKWDIQTIQSIMNDHTNPLDARVMDEWAAILTAQPFWLSDNYNGLVEPLMSWDGQYAPNSTQPTLFVGLLYHVLHEALADELGEERFQLFLETHQIQRAYGALMFNDSSVWWDIKGTAPIETRAEIVERAYKKTISQLREKWGDHPKTWAWGNSAQVEMKHPLGEVSLFRPFFNLGPNSVYGGNECIRQAGYYLDSTLSYKVFYGSQMRIIVDFTNPDSALNVTPAGQSGHVMSCHYDDQYAMYLSGQFRVMRMNRANIEGKNMKLVPLGI